jgi:hypothetical protein
MRLSRWVDILFGGLGTIVKCCLGSTLNSLVTIRVFDCFHLTDRQVPGSGGASKGGFNDQFSEQIRGR